MVTKVVPGVLIATPDAATAAQEACASMTRAIARAINDRGGAAIALSGGSSPLEAYRLLAGQPIEWNKVHVYWVDERSVSPDHERSNYRAARLALLDAIPIPTDNIHRMRGESPDLERAAVEYEAELRNVRSGVSGLPALDLVVLGVGDDGHTASLFPGDDTVHVTDRLVAVAPAANGREARLSLTPPVLESARSSIVIALGRSKHEPLERIWATSGDLEETPARIIRSFRGAITWVVDRAAGGMA